MPQEDNNLFFKTYLSEIFFVSEKPVLGADGGELF